MVDDFYGKGQAIYSRLMFKAIRDERDQAVLDLADTRIKCKQLCDRLKWEQNSHKRTQRIFEAAILSGNLK